MQNERKRTHKTMMLLFAVDSCLPHVVGTTRLTLVFFFFVTRCRDCVCVHDPAWWWVKASNLGGPGGPVVRFNLAHGNRRHVCFPSDWQTCLSTQGKLFAEFTLIKSSKRCYSKINSPFTCRKSTKQGRIDEICFADAALSFIWCTCV